MALLVESVPSFEETCIECLGDLARYRMVIGEADLRDREIWSVVARVWYSETADKSPNGGIIQHHLAVLTRPNIGQQISISRGIGQSRSSRTQGCQLYFLLHFWAAPRLSVNNLLGSKTASLIRMAILPQHCFP